MIELLTIKKCQKGDQRAFKVLYDTTVAYVFSIVKRYVYDASLSKDLVQDAYAQIFTSINNYNEKKGEFKPYLRKITVNVCLMHLRSQKSLPILNAVEDIYEEPQYDKGHSKIDNLNRKDIEKILINMPEGYKTIFLLHIIDEFDYSEIAKMLGITRETARSQYFRAKKWIINKSIIDTKSRSYGLF